MMFVDQQSLQEKREIRALLDIESKGIKPMRDTMAVEEV